MKHYAIETIGYGKKRRYCIKQVVSENAICRVDGKCYKTEEDARNAAAEIGIEIEAVGNLYEILWIAN